MRSLMSSALGRACRSRWQKSISIHEHLSRPWISITQSSTTTRAISIQRKRAACSASPCNSAPSFSIAEREVLINGSHIHARSLSASAGLRSNSPSGNVQTERTNSHRAVYTNRAHSHSILITGGTSGIGFAIAKQAVLEGASHVRIVTRDEQRGQATVERLRKETSTDTKLDYVVAEADRYGDARLFQQQPDTASSQTPFTTVVHSAGITQTNLLTSTQPDAIKEILSVNLESAALLTKSHLKRYMQTCISLSRQQNSNQSTTLSSPYSSSKLSTTSKPNQPTWQIINIASLLAQKGGVGTSIYAASKAGLIALTRATVLESAEITNRYAGSAPGFRANVVVPGYIDTPMTRAISGPSRDKLIREIPTGRFGAPEEVADAVLFLLGNDYANNCVLNLDGGLSAV